jgi:hypothetical protein
LSRGEKRFVKVSNSTNYLGSTYATLLENHPDLFPDGFDLWIRKFGNLKEQISHVLYTSLMWTRWCSPKESTNEQRCIAGADLAMFFFAIDDELGEDRMLLYDDVQELLDGTNSRPTSEYFRGAENILRRMGDFGLPLDRYINSRKNLLAKYRLRHTLSKGGQISFSDYLEIRKVTIYIDQWLDMWEILGDFYLGTDELERLSNLKRKLVLWHVLKNDLVSVERDRDANTPNLVYLYEAQHGIGHDEAYVRLEEQSSAAIETFREELDNLRREQLNEKLEIYMNLLQVCYEGGVRNYYHENPKRYHR